MKKIMLNGMVLLAAVLAGAQDVQKITVTGDRVSLRAAPQITAVLLSRAALNDQMVVMDDSNPGWVGVRPPEDIDLWVHGDFIEDDKVTPARLNIRSGPSRSHGVVGVVAQGDELTVRGKLDGWLRIAPPTGTTVWISRKYTTLSAPEPETAPQEPVLITLDPKIPAIPIRPLASNSTLITLDENEPATPEEPKIVITVEPSEPAPAVVVEAETEEAVTPEPAPVEPVIKEEEEIVKTVLQPVINDVLAVTATMPDLPEVLAPDPDKEQGREAKCSGTLRPANDLLYKVVDPGNEEIIICYVRGNLEQMEACAGHRLILSGKAYWAVGIEPPMMVPDKIEMYSQTAGE